MFSIDQIGDDEEDKCYPCQGSHVDLLNKNVISFESIHLAGSVLKVQQQLLIKKNCCIISFTMDTMDTEKKRIQKKRIQKKWIQRKKNLQRISLALYLLHVPTCKPSLNRF